MRLRWISAVITALFVLCLSASVGAETTLRFTLWQDVNTWDGTMAVIEEFMELHPDINIEVEVPAGGYEDRLLAMHAAGAAPDIMLSQDEPFQALIEAGVFMDLTNLVARDKADLKEQLDDYWPSQHQVTRYKGRYYGLPGQVGGGVVTYFNRDLFDQAGLAYPSKNWTFDDFAESGKRLTVDRNGDGTFEQWAVALSGWWPYALNWVWSAGGSLLSQDHTESVLDQPQAVEGLKFMHDLIHIHQVAPAPGVPGANWGNGTQAMRFGGTWDFGRLQKTLNFSWDVAHLPQHPSRGTRGTRVTWNIVTISPQTQHLAEAWEFVKFFSSIRASEIIWEQSRMPFPPSVAVARTMVDPRSPQHEAVMIEALLEYGHLQPITPFWREMDRIIGPHLGALMKGEVSAKVMASQVATEINVILDAGK